MTEKQSKLQSFDENQRWKLLIEAMTDYAIFMLDPEGRVASWNSGAERAKGYHASEIIGQHFSVFYTAEERAAGVPEQALQQAERQGHAELEGWRLRKDGSRFWAIVLIDPIRDEAGNLIGFAKVTRDITERVMTRRALMESERRFRLFVRSVTDYAIYMLDPDGIITNWNAGAERIKGYREDEIVGRHFSIFYTEEDRAAGLPEKSLETAKRAGKYDAEGTRMRKDGGHFLAHVVVDPVYDLDGSLLGYAKITRDVTEQRQTEADLQRAREDLFQSQKMEAVGRLTGVVAHDFNNLLTVIVNGMEILSRKELTERERRLLNNAQVAASRGAKLTNQLLAFSRRQPLLPHVHDINRLVGGFEAVLRGAGGVMVEIESDLADGLKPVRIDSAQFEAALLNLVVNARDAMPDGGTVSIATACMTCHGEVTVPGLKMAGDYITVTVCDQGTGIPPDVREHIFEPFFTTKDIGKGTGLGLSQVHGFAVQSGGAVEIVSSDASGTCIRLYLPVSTEGAEQVIDTDDLDGTTLAGLKVLVVEDEEEVLESAVAILETIGCVALMAPTAAQALKMIKANPTIDILFTDIVLRDGMNGFELARLIQDQRPNIGIILTSGHPGGQDEYAIVAGAQFLPKPYRMKDLARRLEDLRREGKGRG